MNQRVVLLGAKSFIGNQIGLVLESMGSEIIKVSRDKVDFADRSCVSKLSDILRDNDKVILAAARSPAKDLDDLMYNIELIENIVNALNTRRLSYVLNISSDAVFSDNSALITETSPMAPKNVHGIMHCMREKIIQENVDANVGTVRPTLVFGPGDPHNGYGPNSFLRLAKSKNDIELYGKGEELRDHIHVDDVAMNGASMIMKNIEGDVNAVTGKVISFMEIALAVASGSGGMIKVITKELSGPMPHNGYRGFNNSRVKDLFPNLKFINVEDYVTETLGRSNAIL